MKNKIKKIFPYIIVMLIVTLIIGVSLILSKIYPFGNIDLAKYDAYYQYEPMLYNFIINMKNGTLSSFNFLNGLGTPTIFNYLYYLASPINLICLIFKKPETMFLSVVVIKVILASIFSLFYFIKRTSNNFISIICAIAYTFSGWFLAYYFNIMWLDCFMIFPLLQYGLEELMNNNKYNIYIFSLAYMMLSNFYMAFLTCVYIFIYYMFNIIIKKDKYINKIKNFQLIMISTIITCLLAAFTIYATYSSFLKMGIYISDVNEGIAPLKFLDFIKSFFFGTFSVNLNQYIKNVPNLSVNLIFIISFIYYFINKKIKTKEKIFTLVAFLFTSFTLFSFYMNFVINCFHTPAGYNFRYTFIFSFYLLIIFIRNFKTFEGKIDFKVYFIVLILMIILISELLFEKIEFDIFVINIVFLLAYTIWMLFYNKNKFHNILLCILVILECSIGFIFALNTNSNVNNLVRKIDDKFNLNDYYRIPDDEKIDISYSTNMNLFYNESVLNTFSSMQYINTLNLLNDLGCATDLKATIYTCHNNDVFNMLFNVEGYYKLPKIYSVKKDVFLLNIDGDDFIENQNNLVLGMSGIENIIEYDTLTSIEANPYIYKVNDNKKYILKINPNMKWVKIGDVVYTSNINYVPEKFKNLIINVDLLRKRSLIYDYQKGDEIEIEYQNKIEDEELPLYYVNKEKLEMLYDYLNSNSIIYETYKSNLIEGKITIEKDEIIFTSIPYDASWEVSIDGKRVEPLIFGDSLLVLNYPAGNHKIKLEYKNNFTIPIIVSLTTFIGLILNTVIRKKKRHLMA